MIARSPLLFLFVLLAVAIGSAISVRIVCIVAIKRALLDLPNDRSSHVVPVPRLGGAAFVPWLLSGAAVLAVGTTLPIWVLVALFGGAIGIGCLGLIDDIRPLPSVLRLSLQLVLAVTLVWAAVAAEPALKGFLGMPAYACKVLLVLWVVGLVNAYNFMDGIDGMAGLQAFLAGIGWVVMGRYLQAPFTIGLGGCIAGAALGFLTLNWPPAKIFMGDVGSTVLGYLLAALPMIALIENKRSEPVERALIAGGALLWPFLADTIFTVIRRLTHRENIFQSHRSHLYQLLVISGLSHRTVTGIYAGLAVVGLLFARQAMMGRTAAWCGFLGLAALLFALLWRWTISRKRRSKLAPER